MAVGGRAVVVAGLLLAGLTVAGVFVLRGGGAPAAALRMVVHHSGGLPPADRPFPASSTAPQPLPP